jgi:hypothetical protein
MKLDPGEPYWFKGDKDVQVQGWIFKPKGFEGTEGDKKWPAIM